MSRTLTLQMPDEIDRSVEQEAARTGQSRESVVLSWLRERVAEPERGTVAAIMPSFGAWQMSPEERLQIERMIQEERSLEDENA
jgi:hypothetical protein